MQGGGAKFCFADMKNEGAPSVVTAATASAAAAATSKGRDGDRIIINVGGNKHETHLSTLKNFPDTRLAWIAESPLAHKNCRLLDDGSHMEYFFDRHPGVFVHVLNYYRTGKLHCPSDVCGPVFEEELNFWGIDELQMEPCCWSTYTRHRDAIAFEKVFTVTKTNPEDDQSDDVEPSCIGNRRNRRYWYRAMKEKIWDSLEKPYSSKGAQILALFSLIVIITSVVTFCLETMPLLRPYKKTFKTLDHTYCAVFTVDFVLRVFSCPDVGEFFRSTLNWCDIMSVLPFYSDMIWTTTYLNVVLVVRLFRIFRLFRFFRFMSGLQVIGHTLRASARELLLLILILLIPMVIFSSLLFYAEQGFDGDPRFYSIPHTFWWAIITMTTVGYGDIVPQTAAGRVIGTMCACFGILIVALPVSVIGSNFSLFYSHAQAQLKLPSKRKQPVLVGAASALMSAVDHEVSSSGSSLSTQSHGGSESHLDDDGSKRLLCNDEEKLQVSLPVEMESIELQCKSAPVKQDYLMCQSTHGSLQSLETKLNQDLGLPTATTLTLGTGLKAMGDFMLNIAAPPQRRMAISASGRSPGLRRSNSGKRRTRSKSGESLRKRTNTNSSDKVSNTSCNDNSDGEVRTTDNKEDSSTNEYSENIFSLPTCEISSGLGSETNLCSPDKQDEERTGSFCSDKESQDEDSPPQSSNEASQLTRNKEEERCERPKSAEWPRSDKRPRSLLFDRNDACALDIADNDNAGVPSTCYPAAYKNTHTNVSGIPRYSKRRSAAINICLS